VITVTAFGVAAGADDAELRRTGPPRRGDAGAHDTDYEAAAFLSGHSEWKPIRKSQEISSDGSPTEIEDYELISANTPFICFMAPDRCWEGCSRAAIIQTWNT
jgi:hypothetical protein